MITRTISPEDTYSPPANQEEFFQEVIPENPFSSLNGQVLAVLDVEGWVHDIDKIIELGFRNLAATSSEQGVLFQHGNQKAEFKQNDLISLPDIIAKYCNYPDLLATELEALLGDYFQAYLGNNTSVTVKTQYLTGDKHGGSYKVIVALVYGSETGKRKAVRTIDIIDGMFRNLYDPDYL